MLTNFDTLANEGPSLDEFSFIPELYVEKIAKFTYTSNP